MWDSLSRETLNSHHKMGHAVGFEPTTPFGYQTLWVFLMPYLHTSPGKLIIDTHLRDSLILSAGGLGLTV